MKNFKKILGLVLCLAMVGSMLTACGGDNKPEETKAETQAETKAPETEAPAETDAPETEAPAEDVTLKLGIYPAEGSDEAQFELHDGYIKQLTTDNPNVKVEKAPYTYAVDTFVPLAESGNCPTIFETWYTEPKKLIAGGYVKDITDILKDRGWLDSMNESVRKLLSSDDGKVYGVPRDGYVLGLMVNVDMFEKAGLVDENGVPKYPKTWDELAEDAKLIKEATGQAGLCLLAADNAGGWHFSNIAWAFGANLVKDNGDGTYTADLASDAAIKAMEYVKSLKWDYDVLTADPTAENWGTGFENIAAGTAAMYIAANDAVNQPAEKGLALDSFGLGALPAGPDAAYGLTGGTPYVFSKDATDAEVNAALDYLVLMGKSPVVTDTVKQGILDGAKTNNELGIPVIQSISGWDSPELEAAQAEAIEQYGNVKEELYASYFDFIKNGNIKSEEPGKTQSMYAALTKVLQEVLTNKDADVAALMKAANEEYQAILDDPNAQ
ncbi:MAG: extracellular solute-binding protein [Lachnospiraceae bacterium]|nr:extracellular solute-binding protein [Lachnospiraceae bacterium]